MYRKENSESIQKNVVQCKANALKIYVRIFFKCHEQDLPKEIIKYLKIQLPTPC